MNRFAAAFIVLAAGAATGCGEGGRRIDLGNGETLTLATEFTLNRCDESELNRLFGGSYADSVLTADDADNPEPVFVRCIAVPISQNEAFNRELFRSLYAAGWVDQSGAANAMSFSKDGMRLGVAGVLLPLEAGDDAAQEAGFVFLTRRPPRPSVQTPL